MKRLPFILIIVLLAGKLAAQTDTSHKAMVMLGVGEHETFINNPAFNSWTMANYGRVVHSSGNISGQFSLTFSNYDMGVYLTANYPFQNMEAYFGSRLTERNSIFSSYLNLEFGQLNAYYKNINPVNYTPTPDQQGQDLELRYFSYYLGISSLNYFGYPNFKAGKKGRHLSLYPGFHVAARYGFPGAWYYGYYTSDVIDDYFKSVTIHNIPNLARFNIDAGFFIGIGTR